MDQPLNDLGWVAGFFCGEGTTSVSRNGSGRAYVQIAIGNTDLENLKRCQAVLGGRLYGPYEPSGDLARLPHYALKIDGQAAANAALDLMWPYLSSAKRAQAQAARDAAAANPPPVSHADRWLTRKARHGPTGGNRPRATAPTPCRREHPLSERYEYTAPGGRTMWKCRACQREKDRGRRR